MTIDKLVSHCISRTAWLRLSISHSFQLLILMGMGMGDAQSTCCLGPGSSWAQSSSKNLSSQSRAVAVCSCWSRTQLQLFLLHRISWADISLLTGEQRLWLECECFPLNGLFVCMYLCTLYICMHASERESPFMEQKGLWSSYELGVEVEGASVFSSSFHMEHHKSNLSLSNFLLTLGQIRSILLLSLT